MKLKLAVLSLLFAASLPSPAHAMVAIGNGNYFIGFTDLEADAPSNAFQIKVQRTFNSRSQFDGKFGYGWGSDYEAYALSSADGGVVIQESGGGDKTRFMPKDFSRATLENYVGKLVDAYQKKNRIATSAATAKKTELMNNADKRDEVSRELGIYPELPVGTKLYTTQRGDKQTLTVVKGGYVREYADGKQELFNVKTDVTDGGVVMKGALKVSRLVDPVKKAQIFYEYNPQGDLVTVTDKGAQTVHFRYNDANKVAEASDNKGNKASYQYCDAGSGRFNTAKKCGKGDLVRSTDTSGGTYSYEYDDNHNITRIGFPKNGKADQQFETITYWPASSAGGGGGGRGGEVKSVQNANGVLVEYKYWQDPKDRDEHYKTDVKTTYASGKSANTSYEYFEKRRADGSHYRYKLISVVDGEKTETIYNECCGQPVQITAGPGVTKFEYFAGTGLPREKDSPTENVKWEYSPKFHGKITKVTVSDKQLKTLKSSEFQYDEKNGQLVKAKTSDGKGIVLLYDAQGRIKEMVDQDKRKITFKYSNNSKPSEIVQEGVGSIAVSYDKGGNIKDVKSQGGRQIAISVAAAFQNLLEIIKPAGIQPI